MSLTDRPTAPDCDVWPKCGCEVTGRPCARLPSSSSSSTTVPAPPPTDAELAAIYLRAFDALTGARATERRALEQLTEGAQQMVARAMVGREGA